MADIQIARPHELGLARARSIATRWADEARDKFDMACTYEEGADADRVSFTRSGVSGTLAVTGDSFSLHARLGFLLGAFKDRIEAEIVKNLEALIAQKDAPGAPATPVADAAAPVAAARRGAKKAS